MFSPFAFIQTNIPPSIIPPSILKYLLIGGTFTAYKTPIYREILKITPSGSVDNTFNIGVGFTSTPYTPAIFFAQQSDGKLLVGGGIQTYSGSSAFQPWFTRLNTDGTLDTTFNQGTGFNSLPQAMVTQSDGKIIVGGQFTSYSGSTRNRIARLNSNGTYDSTFNIGTGFDNQIQSLEILSNGDIIVGGSFTNYKSTATSKNYLFLISSSGENNTSLNIGTAGFNSNPTCFATQSDGKIVVGGNFTTYSGSSTNTTRIMRLNPNGTQDTTFVTGAGLNGAPNDLVIQSDGKIIVVGSSFTTYSGSSSTRIVRINSNGTRDTTYNVGTGLSGQAYSLAIQSDNKVLVGGNQTNYSASGGPSYLQRINTDGTRDTTWSATVNNLVTSVKIQPDNKKIIGGTFTTYSGSTRNRIVRTNADSDIDNTFNIGTGASSNVYSLGIQPNGKILVAGQFSSYSGSNISTLAKLNTDGTLDSTFNPGTGFNPAAHSYYNFPLVTDSSGRIFAGGPAFSYSGSNSRGMVVISPSGSIDTSYNYNQFGGFNGDVYAILITGSNILVGGGMTTYKPINYLVCLNDSGSFSSQFNFGQGANTSPISSFAKQSDGKILVVGSFTSMYNTSYNRIVRLNPTLTLDTTFNVGTGLNSYADNVKIQPDGKTVVVGGFTSYSGSTNTGMVRINPSGTLDTTFNQGNGFGPFPGNPVLYGVNVQSDGKIIVTGGFGRYSGSNSFNIARINPSGTLDTTFNIGSSTPTITGSGVNGVTYKSLIDPSGNVYVGAYTTFTAYSSSAIYNRSLMLSSNGDVSSSFNTGFGLGTTKGFNGAVYSYATQSNGKIIAVGIFTTYSGSSTSTTRIIRLNTNGTQDTTFNSGAGFGGSVYDIKVQSDDKIIAVGAFTSYSGSSINRIARLNINGTLDNTFNVGTGAGSSVHKIALQSDGKPIIIGQFTAYSGSAVNRITRLNTSGSRDLTFNVGTGLNSNYVSDIKIQPDGKTLVVGQFTTYSGSATSYSVRINTDGTRDNTFSLTSLSGNYLSNVAIQPDGKILLAGRITSLQSTGRNGIVRTNNSGSIDTSFDPGTGFPSGIFSSLSSFTQPTVLEIDSDGSIYCGATFSSYNGTPSIGLIKLQSNGSIDTTFNVGSGNSAGVGGEVCAILLF
jgi:uncharacterized delta-60 repeat protein